MPRSNKATKRSPSTSKSPRNIARAARPKALPAPTASEAAFEALLASFGVLSPPANATETFVERVFARSDDYLHDIYATIDDAPRFHTKLAGVSFEGRQDVIAGLR
ncbi:MAG: hypothetical protein WAK16_08030, partial [Candidatus Cybelea sp.]